MLVGLIPNAYFLDMILFLFMIYQLVLFLKYILYWNLTNLFA